MEGIQFVTNDSGERVAVQIDLRKYGDLWEDVYDSLSVLLMSSSFGIEGLPMNKYV